MSVPANPYYRYFKNINRQAIIDVRHWAGGIMTTTDRGMIKIGNSIWETTEENAFNTLMILASSLSGVYDIQKPSDIHKGTREVYYIHQRRIELPRISLISFLHEYRHHMQHIGNLQHYRDKEDDARGWSISLFAQALPDIFDKAWRNGRIWYLPPYNPNWRQEVGL